MGTASAPPFRVSGRSSAVRTPLALVDAGVAALLLAGALVALAALSGDDRPTVAVASCVAVAASVALRRWAPVSAAVVALAALVAYERATHDPNGAFPPVAVVLTFYTVGRRGLSYRHRMSMAVAAGLGLGASLIVADDLGDSPASGVSTWLGVVIAPLAVGIILARRSELGRQLESAAGQLRAEQGLTEARATAEERNRVARDLHDVVTHCVSVMVVQAGAARLVAAQAPADADRALAVIGGCGRDAMADVRRIVGVLHRKVDPDFGSGAGLGDLARLVERIRLAGVPTHLSIDGDPQLPPAGDVVAYRVAQEALTNVVKHAGAGATAAVNVSLSQAAVTVVILNSGGAAPPASTHSGRGLFGMRERVMAYGGELHAGPLPDGGYVVRAQLPVRPPEPRQDDRTPPSWQRATRAWRRTPGWVTDVTIAIGWLIAMEAEAGTSTVRRGPWILNAAAVGVMAIATVWRRRAPLLFLAVVGALAAALSGGLTSLDRSTVTGLFTLVVPLFTVAAWEARTRAWTGLALWAGGLSVLAVIHQAVTGGGAGALAMGFVVWTAGRVWRAQRVLAADLTETTARLADERDQRAQLAVAGERIRIARELHGLVAHGVVSMVVQAEAARSLLGHHQLADAERAIRGIEQTGRKTLTQLRSILGVLRSADGTPAGRTPTTDVTAPEHSRGESINRLTKQVLT